MAYPPWFHDWAEEAVRQLDEKVDHLRTEYRLEEQPSCRFDMQAGTVTYGKGKIPEVIAEIQVVGTTNIVDGDWMWGWANSCWPATAVEDIQRVREFGEKHGIEELTRARLIPAEDLEGMARGFTAIAVRVVDALGAFRLPRDDGAGCYMLVKSINWARSEQREATRGRLTSWLKRLKG
jgi:hypothetical protein